ncbi:MAG: hypothetical protein JWQ35_337, partial [Bacteriovoracaceae bacterium]|nr:hypothetical protein [Bacteriovoracaceae bacterium]
MKICNFKFYLFLLISISGLSFRSALAVEQNTEQHNLFSNFPYQLMTPLTFSSASELYNLRLKDNEKYLVRKYAFLPIYFLEFGNEMDASLAMDRLSSFVELRPGEVLSDAELKRMKDRGAQGFEGYDFKLDDIVQFFNKAKEKQIELNEWERRIKDELENADFIQAKNGIWIANSEMALIATEQPSEPAIIDHELNHGVYFTNQNYRTSVQKLWSNLSTEDQKIAKDFMRIAAPYDFSKANDLAAREFVAYFRAPQIFFRFILLNINKADSYREDHGDLRFETARRLVALTAKVRDFERSNNTYQPQERGTSYLKNFSSIKCIPPISSAQAIVTSAQKQQDKLNFQRRKYLEQTVEKIFSELQGEVTSILNKNPDSKNLKAEDFKNGDSQLIRLFIKDVNESSGQDLQEKMTKVLESLKPS